MPISFDTACKYVLPIGPHKGRTIADVGVKASGLDYLNWLSGNPATDFPLEIALNTYLADPAIRAELNELLGKGTSK